MTVDVIYIAGYGRSGSTLLDTAISNCDGYTGIGEASNIFDDSRNNIPCCCGDPIDECSFWKKYLGSIHEIVRFQQRVCEGVFGPLFFYFCSAYRNFWRNFLSEQERLDQTVVDSSKISRVTLFRPVNLRKLGAKVLIVHLYKQPDLLLCSLLKGSNKDLAEGLVKAKVDRFFLIRSFLGAWVSNFFTVLVGRFFVDSYVQVDYEDFINDPIGTLSRIGVHDPSIDFSRLSVGHAISGNRMRRSGMGVSLENSSQYKDYALVSKYPFFQFLFRSLSLFYEKNSY